VAKIETEKLLAGTIEQELEKIRHHGNYTGVFQPQFHSFGYDGREGGREGGWDCNANHND